MFSFDYLEPIAAPVKTFIMAERLRYVALYRVIEDFCHSHRDVILGGTIGADLLLGKTRDENDFVYHLYTEHISERAKELADLVLIKIEGLDQEFDPACPTRTIGNTLLMKTTIPNAKCLIIVDGRTLVHLYQLADNALDLIKPLSLAGFEIKETVQVVSPEIQLIDIYRTLYSPSAYDEWPAAWRDEKKLASRFKRRTVAAVSGNDEPPLNFWSRLSFDDRQLKYHRPTKLATSLSYTERQKIEVAIIKSLVGSDLVLVGDHAFRILMGTATRTNIVQIITAEDLENTAEMLVRVIRGALGRSLPITVVVKNMQIMQDFRLHRLSLRVGEEQKEVAYIYDAAQYDPIPFVLRGEIRLGNPFVLMRFLLINFWIVRWIRSLGRIDETYAEERLETILDAYVQFREFWQSRLSELPVFQSEPRQYLGYYDDELIAQKIAAINSTRHTPDYFPASATKKNN